MLSKGEKKYIKALKKDAESHDFYDYSSSQILYLVKLIEKLNTEEKD